MHSYFIISWNDKPSSVNNFNVNNPVIYLALHVSVALTNSKKNVCQKVHKKVRKLYNYSI
jgi:hypothetical protein